MAMKPTDLARLKGTKIMGQMKQERIPGHPGADTKPIDRRERRRLDQAAGLVPFAVKLDQALVKQVTDLAQARGASLTAVVDELLRAGLAGGAAKGAAKTASRGAAKGTAKAAVNATDESAGT